MSNSNDNERYARAERVRQAFVDEVVSSASPLKIVVAGPGTGKTTLFKQVLNGKRKTLTLTFVNSLVEDLSLELAGLSEVRTLHSFAREVVKKFLGDERVNLFPRLPAVIEQDAVALLGESVEFNKLFYKRDDANPLVAFYSRRRRYYDDHFGYTDIVFAAVKYLEKDAAQIPSYEQVVVDEFQDFNALEVSLIDLLASRSPILLAGDDDQALYDFKLASTRHIRERYGPDRPEYDPFTLPFCSRCTRVIVNAVNDLVAGATAAGHLAGRVPKRFEYFECEIKDVDSANYPRIIYAEQVFERAMPWFIGNQIEKVAKELRGPFSVLVICPTGVKCHSVAEGLRKKGFQNVDYVERPGENVSLLDGLKLILEKKESNLGWRIVSKTLLQEEEFKKVLEESAKPDAVRICDLVSEECRAEVKEMLAAIRAVEKDESADLEVIHSLLAEQATPYDLGANALADALGSAASAGGSPGIRNIAITVTTIQSSKGLSEDFVFMTHFDDRYYVSEQGTRVTDLDICKALVAMTRAKRKLYLLSTTRQKPTFLKWIGEGRIEVIPAAKD